VLVPDSATNVFCLATDPDGDDTFAYSWQANSGTFADPSSNSTSWTAGSLPGEVALTCQVTDEHNRTDSESQTVRVYPTGLIAYYNFSLDAADKSGNGHNGTVSNAVYSSDSSGDSSSSLQFDGSDGQVSIAEHSDFDLAAYSFVAVVNLTSANQERTLVSKASAGFGNFTIRVLADNGSSTAGHLVVSHEHAAGDYDEVTVEFPVGVFVHLAVTVSTVGGTTVYIDGTPVYQTTSTPIPAAVQNDVDVRIANGPSGGFVGILDEVQFYDRVLSADEVAAIVPLQ
jgi:hypothetical protein